MGVYVHIGRGGTKGNLLGYNNDPNPAPGEVVVGFGSDVLQYRKVEIVNSLLRLLAAVRDENYASSGAGSGIHYSMRVGLSGTHKAVPRANFDQVLDSVSLMVSNTFMLTAPGNRRSSHLIDVAARTAIDYLRELMSRPNLDPGASFLFTPVTFTDGDYLSRGANMTGMGANFSRSTLAFSFSLDAIPVNPDILVLFSVDDPIADLLTRVEITALGLNVAFSSNTFTSGTNGLVAFPITWATGQKYNMMVAIDVTTEVVRAWLNGVELTANAYTFLGNTAFSFSPATNWRIGRGFAVPFQFLGDIGLAFGLWRNDASGFITNPGLFFNGSNDKDFSADLGVTIPNPQMLFGLDQTVGNWNAGTARSPATGGNWAMTGTVTAA